MYIVSKFHDYYDTASIYGIDKTVVYKREESSHKIGRPNWYSSYCLDLPDGTRVEVPRIGSNRDLACGKDKEWELNTAIVGFCGSFYPVVIVNERFKDKKLFFYNVEDFNKFVDENGLFNNNKRSYYSIRWDKYKLAYEKGRQNFFTEVSEMNQKCSPLFHAFKTPVMVITDKHLDLNPCLKNYGFMKVKEPTSAFQDIYMFISGVIGIDEKPMVQVSDEVKAASRGHDGPYSFRKPPGKRGKNKWR